MIYMDDMGVSCYKCQLEDVRRLFQDVLAAFMARKQRVWPAKLRPRERGAAQEALSGQGGAEGRGEGRQGGSKWLLESI